MRREGGGGGKQNSKPPVGGVGKYRRCAFVFEGAAPHSGAQKSFRGVLYPSPRGEGSCRSPKGERPGGRVKSPSSSLRERGIRGCGSKKSILSFKKVFLFASLTVRQIRGPLNRVPYARTVHRTDSGYPPDFCLIKDSAPAGAAGALPHVPASLLKKARAKTFNSLPKL